MKTMSKIVAASFVLFMANKSFAQASSTATASATATIITPIAINKTVDLRFGNVAVHSTNSGTVALSTADVRTPSGGVTLPATTGTFSAATFAITGDGNRAFIITIPSSTVLSDGASHNMTVNGFVSSLGSSSTLSSGAATLKIGATLNVNGGQAAGDYSGTFDVTVDYQ